MKETLSEGLSATREVTVDETRVIGFMGEAARVYATPSLVLDIEMACRDLALEHLDEGEDSVGTRVEIDHLAATPLGMTVEIGVTVAALEGRAITFDVTARDQLDTICKGTHKRFIVDIERTVERLEAKIKAAGG